MSAKMWGPGHPGDPWNTQPPDCGDPGPPSSTCVWQLADTYHIPAPTPPHMQEQQSTPMFEYRSYTATRLTSPWPRRTASTNAFHLQPASAVQGPAQPVKETLHLEATKEHNKQQRCCPSPPPTRRSRPLPRCLPPLTRRSRPLPWRSQPPTWVANRQPAGHSRCVYS